MKLRESQKPNKINITYDNEHYCNKFGFLVRPQKSHFFSPLRKKSIFTEDLFAEDHVTEKIE